MAVVAAVGVVVRFFTVGVGLGLVLVTVGNGSLASVTIAGVAAIVVALASWDP